jgi:hypothetical protein
VRVYGLTVGRNEAQRYLIPMLMHATEVFDDVFFFDDQSTDDTPFIVSELNCSGMVRPDSVPSFHESEGGFRAGAWEAFEQSMQPRPGDWVMVIDCDEVLVSWSGADGPAVRESLEKVIAAAGGHVGVTLDIPEVFGFDDEGYPLVRLDRLWGTIHAPRLFAYRPGGQYYQGGTYGVPAVPSYVMGGPWFGAGDTLKLMHYGYAEALDQEVKYKRYSGQGGHSNDHVESIVADDKVLTRWEGPFVPMMRAAWTRST